MAHRGATAAALVVALGACIDRETPPPARDGKRPGSAAATTQAAPFEGEPEPGASATGRAGPPPGQPALPGPDPKEPGLTGLVRLARYVFREMQRGEAQCPLRNPFHDTLAFTLETEVSAGRIVRVDLAAVAVRDGGAETPLGADDWPAELEAFVGCLERRLLAIEMAPAPPDGVYRPEYAYPGHAAAAPPS